MFNNEITNYCLRNFVDWDDNEGIVQLEGWRSLIGGANIISIRPSNKAHRFRGQEGIRNRNKLCDFMNAD